MSGIGHSLACRFLLCSWAAWIAPAVQKRKDFLITEILLILVDCLITGMSEAQTRFLQKGWPRLTTTRNTVSPKGLAGTDFSMMA